MTGESQYPPFTYKYMHLPGIREACSSYSH
jgi:hypothetical protein